MSPSRPPRELGEDELYRRFMRRLPLALLVAMAAWLLLRPLLDASVTWLAETLIRAFEYPRVTRLVAVDHLAEIRRADFRSGSAIPTVALTEVHFNTIVLFALCFALPSILSRLRLERLVMAWSLLWVTQGLNLLFHVKTAYALDMGDWSQQHYGEVSRNLWSFLRYFTDLPGRFSFPFLLWLAFNWDVVSRLVLGARSHAVEGRAQRPRRRR